MHRLPNNIRSLVIGGWEPQKGAGGGVTGEGGGVYMLLPEGPIPRSDEM